MTKKSIPRWLNFEFWKDAWDLVSLRIVQLLLLGAIVALVWLTFWVWIPEIRASR